MFQEDSKRKVLALLGDGDPNNTKLPLPAWQMRELLRYNATTGELFWLDRGPELFDHPDADALARRWNAQFSGKLALNHLGAEGYRSGTVLRTKVKAHRAAWALYYGLWPSGVIDHINGDRSDNRIINLRDTTHVGNGRNAARSIANSSGYTGVSWCAQQGRWKVQLREDGKKKTVGRFKVLADAVAARDAEYQRLGFHPNHGRR